MFESKINKSKSKIFIYPNRRGYLNKRGLSTIVTSLLLILLVIVAVGIVWIVVRNVLQGGTEGIFLDKFTIDAQIKNVQVDNQTNSIDLTVKRNSGEGEITGLKFIFYNETASEIIELCSCSIS